MALFERFTERARQVVILAQADARARGHQEITSEHLLMGVVKEEEGLGARVLASMDIDERALDAWMQENMPSTASTDKPPSGQQIPFTNVAKRDMELALREALSLGHNYIGTEHLLLGLLRGGTNTEVNAVTCVAEIVDPTKTRAEVIRMLSGAGSGGLGKMAEAYDPAKVLGRRERKRPRLKIPVNPSIQYIAQMMRLMADMLDNIAETEAVEKQVEDDRPAA